MPKGYPGKLVSRSEIVRRHRDSRRSLLSTIKLEAGCIDCGYNKSPAALDFDHRDPSTKSFELGRVVGANTALDTVLKEVEKCDVRCANCHRERTYREA